MDPSSPHKRGQVNWRPPDQLARWIRREAKRRGLNLGEFLTFVMETERRQVEGRP
jgi:hypothetical protein